MNLGETPLKRTSLIRLGGLATMVGGVASATMGLLYALQAQGVAIGPIGRPLQKGNYENLVLTMLLVGVLIAIAALHVIQRRDYGTEGALASLAAFLGVAMTVGGNLLGEFIPAPVMASVAIILLGVGALAASFGVVSLGIVTITAQVLPRWSGVALIAGSPPAVGLEFMFLSLAWPGAFWTLVGVPWLVVGYSIFRAAGRLPERPSRVR